MNTQEIISPTDALVEVVAALLVRVGGCKDAAEAVQQAAEIVEDFASPDSRVSLEAAMELRTLTIKAQGATNYEAALRQDDADQSVRFIADEGESLPAGPVSGSPITFDQAVANALASIFPGVNFEVEPLPEADTGPQINPGPGEEAPVPQINPGPGEEAPKPQINPGPQPEASPFLLEGVEFYAPNPFGGFTRIG